MNYEKLQGMDLHYMVRDYESRKTNKNALSNGEVSRSTRIMTNAAGKYLPGTLINYSGFKIPNDNADLSGIKAPQINEHARIQTSIGYLDIWGAYADAKFGQQGADVTAVNSAVFKGNGTGAFKDVSLVRIFYDNDGSVLGKSGLRKLVLFKETYEVQYLMDAKTSDLPSDGVLDKIFIFRNNALNIKNRTFTRKEGTLGAILIVGNDDKNYGNFTDFDQIPGLKAIPPANKKVKHSMESIVLNGLGNNEKDINALTLVNLDNSHMFNDITVNDSQDDGIEIFGGSVNMSNIKVHNALDDYFDTDHGHSGTITNLNLNQKDGSKGKSLIECGKSKGTTQTKFVNLTYKGGYDTSSYKNNGSDKNFNIKSGSSVSINGQLLTEPTDSPQGWKKSQ